MSLGVQIRGECGQFSKSSLPSEEVTKQGIKGQRILNQDFSNFDKHMNNLDSLIKIHILILYIGDKG